MEGTGSFSKRTGWSAYTLGCNYTGSYENGVKKKVNGVEVNPWEMF